MRHGLDWYKRYPRDFVDGVQGLGPELIGAYSVILDLLYSRGGEMPRDDHHLGGVLGCSKRKAKTLTDQLIETGKLSFHDGFITNSRVENETKRSRMHHEASVKGGRKSAELRAEANKNKDIDSRGVQATPATIIDKNRIDNTPLTPLEGELVRAYEMWNELAAEYPSLPRAIDKTGPTRNTLKTRLKQEGIDGFKKALDGIRASKFHRNEESWGGMNLAWAVKASNFEKLQMLADAPPLMNGSSRDEENEPHWKRFNREEAERQKAAQR